MMRNNCFGVTNLDESRLASVIPVATYGGGPLAAAPSTMLFLWRSCGTEKARDGTLCFYLSDDRLAPLWTRPERYAVEFKRFGVAAVVEPDFSLWCDAPLEVQLHNIRRTRVVSRIFQEYGIAIIPNLNWADEASFRFAFSGIPTNAPVVSCECRTAGSCDEDRRRFLAGLTEGVKQLEPQNVLVYGGTPNEFWLDGNLPQGPVYHLIDSWTDSRARVRKAQAREVRDRNQPELFSGGTEQWVEEEATAV